MEETRRPQRNEIAGLHIAEGRVEGGAPSGETLGCRWRLGPHGGGRAHLEGQGQGWRQRQG
eukprot:7443677-Pyramimonas_sp.AAC.1